MCTFLTWKTLGALTSEAKAEDRVAEKIPAEIRGPKPDTRLITWTTHKHTVLDTRSKMLLSLEMVFKYILGFLVLCHNQPPKYMCV